MEFTETKLKGGFVISLKKIGDHRGYFARAFCRHEFTAHGLNPAMIQLNTAFSHTEGTVRGMHYQEAPHQEAKLMRCTRGRIYDVIVDLRPDSPTHKQWVGVELSAENGVMLYAPEGFAHGYQTLTPEAEMYYMTTMPYAPAAAKGVPYNDPAFAIEWPLPVSLMSTQDQGWQAYSL